MGYRKLIQDIEPLERLEILYNEDREEVETLDEATWKYVTLFDEEGEITEQYSVDIIDGVDQEYIDMEEAEEFDETKINREPEGSSKGGQFAKKEGGDVSSYKEEKLEEVEPDKKIKDKQKNIDKKVTDKVEDAIKELGIEDKIYDVAMQGSYEKGTDLPSSGSDMDLFVVFNTDVSQEERDKFGLEIGRKVLTKDFVESQGWDFDYNEEVTATSKYVQAFFKDGEQDVEVQIVPTRHLTLEQIKEKKLNGEDIDIGMERTPHQTEYMKEALKGKEGEVRVLKKFMKEAGLYGSSLKQMGFSGYSAETLIDNFGTFEDVIDFFSELKEGDIVDKQGGGKRNKQNAFSIIDPIDPNRDLVSAFSTLKIGKTINVAKKFKETGEIPESKYKEMDSATLSFETDETNEDKLIGQVRKLAKSYQKQLKKPYGFSVKSKEENVNGIKVDVPDFSFDAEWDNDKQKNIVKINFGTDTMTIPENIETYLPEEANIEAVKKGGKQVITRDGKNYSVEPAKFTSILDAIRDLSVNWKGKLVETKQNNFIKDTGVVSSGKAHFEELS
jgi:tRNA nucleotidyltransferase (CCA-adding enzyme)